MNDLLQFLQNRNSAPKLTEPGPSSDELAEMVRAGLRAPDHAWLRPWRFIEIVDDRRAAFGEVLHDALLRRDPEADEAARQKALKSPLRAPVLLVAVVKFSEHPKVPHIEQWLSAGCAAHGVLLAAEALGYAGIWRTGPPAFDRNVMDALGLEADEEIAGFLYLGSREAGSKPLPQLEPTDYLSSW